jgi:hypothetical protein
MLVVYKYALKPIVLNDVEMPEDSQVLHVDCQSNTFCIWALVNPDKKKVVRRFLTVGTGYPLEQVYEDKLYFHGSFLMSGGAYVWHIFEVANGEAMSDDVVQILKRSYIDIDV